MSDSIRIVARDLLARGFGVFEKIVFERRRSNGDMQTMTREILDTGDGVTILPYDLERQTIILIRQFRGVAFLKDGKPNLIETCAGKLEGADPLTRIVKETEEETGIKLSGPPRRLFECYMSPGSFAERLTFFVAPYTAADRITNGGGLIDEGEDIEVIETTLDAALAMVDSGEIVDVKTILLLHYARSTGLMTQ
ncbi:NUDIX domain-containing protein [Beijerinckia sp. L45]|uniref:NUDIX domain-containing protein n=1 Tax=Beijerinckia sp. L45 TaxID=1641855 RepID=UPI001AEF29B6|nr:NUDIX domain-containing protein [Beijerinckia sp. L45]